MSIIRIKASTQEGVDLPLEIDAPEGKEFTVRWDPEDPRAKKLGVNGWTDEEWAEFLKSAFEILPILRIDD